MGNIAIVGVEQSGKTALMVSWGWHYQHPDKNGYYRPVLAAHFPNVRLFAVSSVNKTIPSEDGYTVPTSNFEAEGVEKLTAWVA